MKKTFRNIVVAGTLAAVGAATYTLAQAPAEAAEAAAGIRWGACPALAEGATRDAREVCGTVTVPLDYRKPAGRTIDVAVSKISTAKPGRRRGYLLLNPGGPALEGLDTPGQMAPELSPAILDTYDLIGFDPRGVGHSNPMSCGLTDGSLDTVFPYPDANGSIAKNVALARSTAQQCSTIAGDLRYYTTANTARDMDRIRAALGTPKISYWGQSYGTYLGSVYTSLFPQHTDRMVLEGNVDPTLVWQKQFQLWDKGVADHFPDAAKVAIAGKQGLGSTVAQVEKTYVDVTNQLDRTPASVPGTSLSLDGSTVRNVTYQLLLHNETLTPLTQFWRAAADLAAGTPLSATDTAVLQQIFADSPAEPGVPADNQITMLLALTCGDTSWSRDLSRYAKQTAADRKAYPLTAGMPYNVTACAFWPYAPIEKPVAVTSNGPRNILILQNRRDHATPWEGGLGEREAFGARAAFVGADNGGHYVYATGNSCADAATDAFLGRGALPARDVYCKA